MEHKTQYLVKISDKKAYMKVEGRANYLNCTSVLDFYNNVLKINIVNFYIDFKNCTGMDSTFLGMLAGLALKLRKINGQLSIFNLSSKNLDIINNLELGQILNIEKNVNIQLFEMEEKLDIARASAQDILQAHENLVDAHHTNISKFEDVITFLKKEIQNPQE